MGLKSAVGLVLPYLIVVHPVCGPFWNKKCLQHAFEVSSGFLASFVAIPDCTVVAARRHSTQSSQVTASFSPMVISRFCMIW